MGETQTRSLPDGEEIHRFDFGVSLCINKCDECGVAVFNRGCEECELTFCKHHYKKHALFRHGPTQREQETPQAGSQKLPVPPEPIVQLEKPKGAQERPAPPEFIVQIEKPKVPVEKTEPGERLLPEHRSEAKPLGRLVGIGVNILALIFALCWWLQWLPDPSPCAIDIVAEVPSLHEALSSNIINIRAPEIAMLKTIHDDIRVIGILGFSYRSISTLATKVRKFSGGHTWVIAQAILPASNTNAGMDRHLKLEDGRNTEQFLLDFFTTISDVLVFIVDDYNWVEQSFVLRYYDTRGSPTRSDSCRDPLILQMSDSSFKGNDPLKMRLRKCIGESVRGKNKSLQDLILDAAGTSLRNIEDSALLPDNFKSAINLSYHDSGIQVFSPGVPSTSVDNGLVEHRNMNVYEVDVDVGDGILCRDRIVEIELPGAKTNEFEISSNVSFGALTESGLEIQTSNGFHRLIRTVSDATYEIVLPFDKAWIADIEGGFELKHGLLTLRHRMCPNP